MMEYGDFQLFPATLARAAIARPQRQNPDCQYFFGAGFFACPLIMIREQEFQGEFAVHDYTLEGSSGSCAMGDDRVHRPGVP